MNILHLEYSGGTGGIEKLCKDIGLHPGVDRQYFVFVHEGGEFYDEMQRAELSVRCLNLKNRDVIKLYSIIKQIVYNEQIDAIVVHHPAPIVWLAILMYMCLPHRARVLIYFHNVYDEVTRHSKVRRRVLNILLKKSDGIIAISEFVKNTVLLNSSVDSRKIHVIYNGIECPDVDCTSEGSLHKPVRILYVGRLIEQKGVQILLRAVSILKDSTPCELRIVGDGPYRSELEDLSKELKIENSVKFCGSRNDVPEQLKWTDIFVHPTIGEEGFGLTVAEALSHGKICIACRKGGIPEIINDGENGFLVESEKPMAIADKIEFVCNKLTIEQRQKIQQNATLRARNFEIENLVHKLHTLVTSVEGKNG